MKNIRSLKYYYFAFGLLSILILASSIFFYQGRKSLILESRYTELDAISDEKIRQVVSWRDDKFADAYSITNDGIFTEAIYNYARTGDKLDSIHIFNWFAQYIKYKDYSKVSVLDTLLNCIACEQNLFLPDSSILISVIESGEPYFSSIQRDPAGVFFLDLYVPLIIKDPGRIKKVGVLILRANPKKGLFDIAQFWPTQSKSSEFLIYSVKDDSVVYLNTLRHVKNEPLEFKYPSSLENLPASMGARGIRGIVKGTDYRGIEVLANLEPIPDSPWLTVTKIDMDEVYAPLYILLMYVLAGVFIILVTTALVIAYLWKTQKAEVFKGLYNSEIEKKALVKNFEYLTKYANDMILLLDNQGYILYANEKTSSHYGYTPDELMKMKISELRADPDNPNTSEVFSITNQRGGYVYEALHRKKDGTVFSTEASARFIKIEDVTYFQTIIRDISEKKSAERELKNALREKEILLKEIHHRVKNNLQIVSSLLALHSNLTDDQKVKKILLDSQIRINSMALIHQQLYTENVAAVNTANYFRNLLDSLVRTLNTNHENIIISTDIENTLLKMDTVIPLGLMMNEILSNIFKHAFPDNRSGKVNISFKKENDNYILTIADDGIGFGEDYDLTTSGTLGMQLIHVLVEQIDGSINISNKTGVKYQISFK